MADTPADIEDTLDQLVGRLKAVSTKEAKALLVDARRLLGLVRNWKSISPTEEARAEMAARVQQLARSVDVAAPPGAPPPSPPPPREPSRPAEPARARAPEPERPRAAEPARILEPSRPAEPARARAPEIVAARSAPPDADELTRAAPIAIRARADEERAVAMSEAAPMRLRTLPDLDISGIPALAGDGDGGLEDRLDPGWVRGRPAVEPLRGRAAPEPLRARSGSDPALRGRSSSNPPNGRGELYGGDRGSDRPTRAANRPSRFLVDPEHDADGAGPVYPASHEDSSAPARNTMTRGSSPPQPARGDKTMIAVRPLPAPEVLDPRLTFLTDPFSPRADAYRLLRRKLSGSTAGGAAPRTIAVASARPEEGRTSCAANLALAFRETSNERILLVDANMKSPGVAKLFGFEPPVCFARQMAKNRDSQRASWTVAEQFEPLHVLAVDPASRTSPMLDPIAFANALEQLVEAGYDHIIIDTPPTLGGSDMNIIADAVDGIVMVAWIKKSKKTQVKQAIDQLKPATILGLVTLEE